jgi:hypothetical protein
MGRVMRGAVEGERQSGSGSDRMLSDVLGDALARQLGVGELQHPARPAPPRARVAKAPLPVGVTSSETGEAFRMVRNIIYLAAALYVGYLIALDYLYPKHDPTYAGPSEFAGQYTREPAIARGGLAPASPKGQNPVSA